MKSPKHGRTIATVSHVGSDVPDEIAYPLVLQRIMGRTKRTSRGCWQWTGYVLPSGYAEVCFRGKGRRVHRLVYEAVHGPIPEGMDVLHSCDNTLCFNPSHLSLGEQSENSTQSVERGRHAKIQNTHCPAGHSYAEHGRVGRTTGWRTCTLCVRIKYRLKAGWPLDLAQSVPRQSGGSTPISSPTWRQTRLKRVRIIKTHCLRNHELSGANLYLTPDGRRQCRTCHHEAVRRFKPKPSIAAGDAPR